MKSTQNGQKSQIFEISKFEIWPISAGNRLICGRKVGLVHKSCQNVFYPKRTKIRDFIPKKLNPPPKRALFFWGGSDFICKLYQICQNGNSKLSIDMQIIYENFVSVFTERAQNNIVNSAKNWSLRPVLNFHHHLRTPHLYRFNQTMCP